MQNASATIRGHRSSFLFSIVGLFCSVWPLLVKRHERTTTPSQHAMKVSVCTFSFSFYLSLCTFHSLFVFLLAHFFLPTSYPSRNSKLASIPLPFLLASLDGLTTLPRRATLRPSSILQLSSLTIPRLTRSTPLACQRILHPFKAASQFPPSPCI